MTPVVRCAFDTSGAREDDAVRAVLADLQHLVRQAALERGGSPEAALVPMRRYSPCGDFLVAPAAQFL